MLLKCHHTATVLNVDRAPALLSRDDHYSKTHPTPAPRHAPEDTASRPPMVPRGQSVKNTTRPHLGASMKRIATAVLAITTLTLTACGGGGDASASHNA